jgi:riboflavin biosynthesis pyrimidine reductase
MLNMVTSVDGAIAIDGLSAGLGGPGDGQTFRAIRASCDWILVAAGTARAERYHVPRPAPDVAEVRLATGRTKAARLAVVTASVELDPGLPMFADQRPGDQLPLIITGATPPPDRVASLAGMAEFAHLDADRPSPRLVINELHYRGASVVLAEGGPTWNGQLAEAGLIDELCLTISPHLVGGASPGILGTTPVSQVSGLTLERLLEHEGALFARYVRA